MTTRASDTIEKLVQRTPLAILVIVALWAALFLPGLRQNGLWDPWEMDRAFLGRELVGPARVLVLESQSASPAITDLLRKAAGSRKVTVRGPKDFLSGSRTPNLVTALGEADRTLYDAIVVDLGLVFPTRSEGEKTDAWVRRLASPMRQLDRLAAQNPQAAIVLTSSNAQHEFKSLLEDMSRARIFNTHQFLRYTIKFWDDHLSAGLPVPEPPYEVANRANFPVLYTVWHRPSDEAPAAKVVSSAITKSRLRVAFKNAGETHAVPVLNAYLIALSYKLLGSTELAARAPFALFGLLGLLLVFFWIRAVRGPRAALLAVIVLGTLPHYFFQGKTTAGQLPFIVSLAGLVASYSLLLHRGEMMRRYLVTFGIAALMVFAAEGLTGLLLALSVVAGNVLVARDYRQVSLAPLYGLAAFFGVMATLVWISDWSFFTHFRMTVTLFSNGPNASHRYFDFFVQQVGFAGLPWSALFPFALGSLFVRLRGEADPDKERERSLSLLMLLWFGFGYLLYSVTLKEMGHFVFPAMIAAAVACGIFLDEVWESGERNVLIGVVFLLAAGILLKEIRTTPGSILGPVAYDPPFQVPGDPATSLHPLFPETLKFSSIAKYTLLAMALGAFLYFSQLLAFLRGLTATRIAIGVALAGLCLHATVSAAVEYDANFVLYQSSGGRGLDATFLERIFDYSEIVVGYTLAVVLLLATVFHARVAALLRWFNAARLRIALLISVTVLLTIIAIVVRVSTLEMVHQLGNQLGEIPGLGGGMATLAAILFPVGLVLLALGLVLNQLSVFQIEAVSRFGTRLAEKRGAIMATVAFLVAGAGFAYAGNALHVFLSVARRISVDATGVPVDGAVTQKFGVSVVRGFAGYFDNWHFIVGASLVLLGLLWLWNARKRKITNRDMAIASVGALLAAALLVIKGLAFSKAYFGILLDEGSGSLTAAQMWLDVLVSPFLLIVYVAIAAGLYLLLHSLVAPYIARTREWRFTAGAIDTAGWGLLLTAGGILAYLLFAAIVHSGYYQLLQRPQPLSASPFGSLLRRGDTWLALALALSPGLLWFLSDSWKQARRLLGDEPTRTARTWLLVGLGLFVVYFVGNLAFEYRDTLLRSGLSGAIPAWAATTLKIYSTPALIVFSLVILLGLGALNPAWVNRIGDQSRWWHIWYAFLALFALVSIDAVISVAMGLHDSLVVMVNELSRKDLKEAADQLTGLELEKRLAQVLRDKRIDAVKSVVAGRFYVGAACIAAVVGLGLNRLWPKREPADGTSKGHEPGSWLARLNPFAFFESRRAIVGLLVVGAVVFCLPLATSFSKKLSYNLSQKHILETFKRSAGTEDVKGKLFKYGTFSLGSAERNFYTADVPSVTLDRIMSGLSQDERKYYIVSRRDFSRLNFDFRSRKNGESLKVLDDRSFAYVLVSNKLGPNEPDRNWVAKSLIHVTEPIPHDNLHYFVTQHVRPLLPKAGFRPGYAEFGIEASKTRQWSQLRTRGVPANKVVPSIVYLGYQSPTQVFSRGKKFKIKMFFLTVNQAYGSYKIFMHVDRVGGGRLHFDHWVLNLSSGNDAKCVGCFETRHWFPGDVVIDDFERDIPIGSDSGAHHMQIGFYLEKGPRLKIIRSGDGISHAADNRLNIGPMTIR